MNREFREVPGYEFEVPRGQASGAGRGMRPGPADPLRGLRPVKDERRAPLPARLAARVVGVMRARNWVTNLAVPIIAAVVVGVAAVVVAGGGGAGGTAATSALATGFPPARLAGADFAGTAPLVLAAIAASAATDVVAGSAGGGPALWVSRDGGSAWRRAALTGPAALTKAGGGQFTGVAHGAAGWLAVGTARAAAHGPIVAGSPDGRTWTVTGGPALPGADAVAAGPSGYVIVGHQPAGGGTAIAWYSRGLTGWRRAAVASPAAAVPVAMNDVTATAGGFAAVGSAGAYPVTWLSATGRSWRPVAVPLPDGAARAALDSVAADGSAVVAAGTEISVTGTSRPFTAVSGDAGATWTLKVLPSPAGGAAVATVTALTAAGRGFIATGTDNAADGADVVFWTLPPGAGGTVSAAWTVVTPQGTGLAGPGTQALTALTAQGATLTGVGFTVPGTVQQPTLWQSPIRY